MTVDQIDVDATVKKVQQLLAQEAHLSPALRSTLDVLLLVAQLLVNRLSLTSRNCMSRSLSICSPAMVGWAINDHLRTSLCVKALQSKRSMKCVLE